MSSTVTLSIDTTRHADYQHKVMLGVAFFYHADCRYAQCCQAQSRGAARQPFGQYYKTFLA